MGTRHLKLDHHYNVWGWCSNNKAHVRSPATINQQWSILGTRHSKLDPHYNSDWNEGFISVRQWIEIICSIRRCLINKADVQSAGLMFIRRADIQSATINQKWSRLIFILFPIQPAVIELVLRISLQNHFFTHFCVCFVPHFSTLVLLSIISQHHDEDNLA